jgi:hypothetical protein
VGGLVSNHLVKNEEIQLKRVKINVILVPLLSDLIIYYNYLKMLSF